MAEEGSLGREPEDELCRYAAVNLVGEFEGDRQFLEIAQPEEAAYCHKAEHGGDDEKEEVVAGVYRGQAEQDREENIEPARTVYLYDRGIGMDVRSSFNSPSLSIDSYPGRIRSL